MTQQFHNLICLNIIFLLLIDLTLLMWFYNYYFFKLLHKNYTLFSLKPHFSNLTFVYFWEVVSHHLHMLPQNHQSHLNLACLFASYLYHLPHIFSQVPLIPQLDHHLWRNVSFGAISNDLEVHSIHHLTWVPWRSWLILANTLIHCLSSHHQNFCNAFPFLHDTWVFYDALHYASPCQSCTVPWSTSLPPTLLLCFHKLELCRQCLMESLYQEKVCSYSIYSIAESNDYLQHD